jgi:hypothetical protein
MRLKKNIGGVTTSLFIEFRRTLEALRNPKNHKINPKAISIIRLATLFFGFWKCAQS